MQKMGVWALGWEDPLEMEMATHFSILAWKIPWAEEAGGLQPMGLQGVGHDWGTELNWTEGKRIWLPLDFKFKTTDVYKMCTDVYKNKTYA